MIVTAIAVNNSTKNQKYETTLLIKTEREYEKNKYQQVAPEWTVSINRLFGHAWACLTTPT